VPRTLTVEDRNLEDRKQRHARNALAGVPTDCRTGDCEHYQEMVRLRRNLHDGLGPGLAGIMMRADILTQLMTANQGAAEEMLHDLRREAASFMAEFRRMLADQSPAELDGHRFDDALRTLGRRMSRASGDTLLVTVHVEPAAVEMDRAAQVAAFWIAKEALTNVVKHARARNCTIRVWVEDGLRLEITDDGVGGAGLGRPGVGLTSMDSRAAELGGWCAVTDSAIPDRIHDRISDGIDGIDGGLGVTVSAHLPAPSPAEESYRDSTD
jgi:signal transduction histidine kinase